MCHHSGKQFGFGARCEVEPVLAPYYYNVYPRTALTGKEYKNPSRV